MPLRVRLIVLIGLVLLISLACGSALVGWRAANSVRTELRAALDVGMKTIRNGIDGLVGIDDRAGELRQLVATFNGNRHVRATLLDGQGQPVAVSQLFVPTQPAPDWFDRLIAGRPGAVRLRVPETVGGGAIALQADPINEIGEVWEGSRDAVLVLAGFAAMSALLIYAVVGRALRQLEILSTAFEHVGKDDCPAALPVHGPPELMRLASGFNLMTRRLDTAAAHNHRLNERLLTLQAEERADLARDLHDEIGPLLFAVDMTAATIARLAGNSREAEIPTHALAIHEAVGRMQRHVRVILGRLRPMQALGLEAAVDRLAAFWRSRRPDIVFGVAVSVDEERIGNDLKETIYRMVQEATSNAIRHGRPKQVAIAIAPDEAAGIRVEVADDGIGMSADRMTGRDPTRLGLIGMRERVMAMAGSLSIQRGRDGKGLVLVARLPWADSPQPQNLGASE